jgi:hypothetical protein
MKSGKSSAGRDRAVDDDLSRHRKRTESELGGLYEDRLASQVCAVDTAAQAKG